MNRFLLSLISSALCISTVTILLPNGSVARYVKLIASLLLVCMLIHPIKSVTEEIRALIKGEWSLTELVPPSESDTAEHFQSLMDATSKTYFLQSLEQLLMREFSIDGGNVRCAASWETEGDRSVPRRITVLLSGSAIWKDPKKIEEYVTALLGCDCVIAIE